MTRSYLRQSGSVSLDASNDDIRASDTRRTERERTNQSATGSVVSGVNEGDYVVAFNPSDDKFEKAKGKPDKRKPSVWKVRSRTDSKIDVRLEDLPHINRVEHTLRPDQVLANLGPTPPSGTVYGTDVTALYRGSKRIDADRNIVFHLFLRPSKEDLEKITNGFQRTVRKLTKLRLDGLLSENVVFEIRPKQGKYAGMFMTSKSDDTPHRTIYNLEGLSEHTADHLVAHEFGHLIEWKIRDYASLWAAWQSVHAATVLPAYVLPADLKSLSQSLCKLATEMSKEDVPAKGVTPIIKTWRSELEDDDKPKATAVIRWLNQQRGIRPNDLERLLHLGKHDLVNSLWPKDTIETKRSIKPIISEYATKNMSETFSESFAMFLTSVKLPEPIQKLLDKTLTTLREQYR